MRRWTRTLAPLLGGALALWLTATPALAETVLVRAGKLVDVVEGRVLLDQLVRIEDGRIAAVSDFPANRPPARA